MRYPISNPTLAVIFVEPGPGSGKIVSQTWAFEYGTLLANLDEASELGNFSYRVSEWSYVDRPNGMIIRSIENISMNESTGKYWVFYNTTPNVSAVSYHDPSSVWVRSGDTWYGDYCIVNETEEESIAYLDTTEYRIIMHMQGGSNWSGNS
ncbi:MAG: hypothetical protein QMD46_07095 [Methanomicrobiales archaeon]|nr:hypothetical protein [Methanomicrobiales archaeon]MDI6876485.1 hypothetical protein [Methanomicrobiales archaeon]